MPTHNTRRPLYSVKHPIPSSFWLLIVLILAPYAALSQAAAPGSDPQAVSFASKAIATLTGGKHIQDITLTGSATWAPNGDETGTATLKALGIGESRVDLALPGGTRTEIRDASAGYAQGEWVNQDGTSGIAATHNLMTDAVWFFPPLTSLAGNSSIVLTYIGQETFDDHSVQHLRSCVSTSGSQLPAALQQFSTMDFYLDSASLLPYAIVFNQHPDDNQLVNIPIKVVFSNYQTIAGIQVPMHIQRYMNGAQILDATLTSAQFNTGLIMADFAVSGGAQ
jgi:hypothetical protein